MILVFGKTGQLARELAPLAGVACVGRDACDLGDPESCVRVIEQARPQAVVNAAAFTDVDGAEADEALATRINAGAPEAMARACAAQGIPMVQVSTDYVFDGHGAAPRAPGAGTAPLGAYGRSKLAGERAVVAAGGVHAILRTSWVFSAHGRNFVGTMLRLGQDRAEVRVVGDQHGGPTPARDLAAACHRAAEVLQGSPDKSGTYHFAGAPDTTWAGFASEIFRQARLACRVTAISTCDWPTPAQRPLNSRLDCASFTQAFGMERPDWRTALAQVLSDLGENAHG